jgi:hypothetical protein
VSGTRKDSKQISSTVLELVAKSDGTFDLLWDGKLDRTGIPERWLNEELCVRFGLCGDEYDAIVLEPRRRVEPLGRSERHRLFPTGAQDSYLFHETEPSSSLMRTLRSEGDFRVSWRLSAENSNFTP